MKGTTPYEWFLVAVGFLSATGLAPTQGTLEAQQSWGKIPDDLSPYHVFLAVADCEMIGEEVVLVVEDARLSALIYDCSGDIETTKWMENNRIVAEIDWWTWQDNPEWIGVEGAQIWKRSIRR